VRRPNGELPPIRWWMVFYFSLAIGGVLVFVGLVAAAWWWPPAIPLVIGAFLLVGYLIARWAARFL
jgi:hypothetical protein